MTRKLNVCSSHDNGVTLTLFPTLDRWRCLQGLSRGCFFEPCIVQLEEVHQRSGGTLPEPSLTISRRRLVQRISHCCSISAASVVMLPRKTCSRSIFLDQTLGLSGLRESGCLSLVIRSRSWSKDMQEIYRMVREGYPLMSSA